MTKYPLSYFTFLTGEIFSGPSLDIDTQIKESIEVGQQIEEDHESCRNHYDPRADFNLPHVRFEPFEHPTKLVYP